MSATIIKLPGVRSAAADTAREEARESARRLYRSGFIEEASKRRQGSSDPMFDAIFVHLGAVDMKLKHSVYASRSFKLEKKEEVASQQLADLCDSTLQKVMSTAPTTWEGVIALLEHIALDEFLHPPSEDRNCHDETYECLGEAKLPAAPRQGDPRLLMQTTPSAA
jgi:hypothetical protein